MLQRSHTLTCREVLVALTQILCPVASLKDSGGFVHSRATPKGVRGGHRLIRVQVCGSSRKKDLALNGGPKPFLVDHSALAQLPQER